MLLLESMIKEDNTLLEGAPTEVVCSFGPECENDDPDEEHDTPNDTCGTGGEDIDICEQPLDKKGDFISDKFGKKICGGSFVKTLRKSAKNGYEATIMVLNYTDIQLHARWLWHLASPCVADYLVDAKIHTSRKDTVQREAHMASGGYVHVCNEILAIGKDSVVIARCGLDVRAACPNPFKNPSEQADTFYVAMVAHAARWAWHGELITRGLPNKFAQILSETC